jgi:hypothetical protein
LHFDRWTNLEFSLRFVLETFGFNYAEFRERKNCGKIDQRQNEIFSGFIGKFLLNNYKKNLLP